MVIEIIKHGDLSKVDREYFICSLCGCEFMVPLSECVMVSKRIAHSCPECGAICILKKKPEDKS